MSNIASFSINADDVTRACHFYENVFGWKFEQMGPPGFGYECTFSVPSVSQIVAAIRAQKGNILMEETVIVGIGRFRMQQTSIAILRGPVASRRGTHTE